MPRVTYVISSFNSAHYLNDMLDSVFNDGYDDLEVFVVDDCSQDSTWQLLSNRPEKNIRTWRNFENIGPSASRQIAIDKSDSEYIAILDADDLNIMGRTRKQLAFLDAHPGIDVLGGGRIRIDEDGGIVGYTPPNAVGCLVPWVSLWRTPIANPTVMLRRSAVPTSGFLFRPDLLRAEDFECWSRFGVNGRLANLWDPLIKYRIHPNQLSKKQSEGSYVTGSERGKKSVYAEIISRNIADGCDVELSSEGALEQSLTFFALKHNARFSEMLDLRLLIAKKLQGKSSCCAFTGLGLDLFVYARSRGFGDLLRHHFFLSIGLLFLSLPALLRILCVRMYYFFICALKDRCIRVGVHQFPLR